MDYVRTMRRPFLLEALVSRLYGHSSSSGALRVKGELDCIDLFERKLLAKGLLDRAGLEQIRGEAWSGGAGRRRRAEIEGWSASGGSLRAQTWGSVLRPNACSAATTPAWLTLWPSIAICLTVFAWNQFGEGLREATDPRSVR